MNITVEGILFTLFISGFGVAFFCIKMADYIEHPPHKAWLYCAIGGLIVCFTALPTLLIYIGRNP